MEETSVEGINGGMEDSANTPWVRVTWWTPEGGEISLRARVEPADLKEDSLRSALQRKTVWVTKQIDLYADFSRQNSRRIRGMEETNPEGIAETDIKKGQRVEHETRTGMVRPAEKPVDKLAKGVESHKRLWDAASQIAGRNYPKVVVYGQTGVESYYLVPPGLVDALDKALSSHRP